MSISVSIAIPGFTLQAGDRRLTIFDDGNESYYPGPRKIQPFADGSLLYSGDFHFSQRVLSARASIFADVIKTAESLLDRENMRPTVFSFVNDRGLSYWYWTGLDVQIVEHRTNAYIWTWPGDLEPGKDKELVEEFLMKARQCTNPAEIIREAAQVFLAVGLLSNRIDDSFDFHSSIDGRRYSGLFPVDQIIERRALCLIS